MQQGIILSAISISDRKSKRKNSKLDILVTLNNICLIMTNVKIRKIVLKNETFYPICKCCTSWKI